MKTFGYIRVSSTDQNEDRQLAAMQGFGIAELFIDKQSGRDFERTEYKQLVKKLKSGDLLYIQSIDRLGRNYEEIQNQWRYITHEIKAHIKVLDMPLLDTSVNAQTLDSRFIADLVLQILSYVAEKERRHIKQRQAEGIALAKAEGRMQGRPKVQKPERWDEIYTKWVNKEITAVAAMEVLNLKTNTFYSFVAQERGKVPKV